MQNQIIIRFVRVQQIIDLHSDTNHNNSKFKSPEISMGYIANFSIFIPTLLLVGAHFQAINASSSSVVVVTSREGRPSGSEHHQQHHSESANNDEVNVNSDGQQQQRGTRMNAFNGRQNWRDATSSSTSLDPTIFLEMVLATPAGALINAAAPETVRGFQSDASKLANRVQSSYGQLTSGLSSGMSSIQETVTNRLKNNQEMVMLVYEALMNPQQYCSNLARAQAILNQAGLQVTDQAAMGLQTLGQTVDNTMQSTGSLASQAGQQSGSMLKRFGSYAWKLN